MATTPTRAKPAPAAISLGEMRIWGVAAAPALGAAARCLLGLAELLLRALALPRPAPRNTAGIRVLRDPKHKVIEPNAEVSRLLWSQRSRRHSRLCVHL